MGEAKLEGEKQQVNAKPEMSGTQRLQQEGLSGLHELTASSGDAAKAASYLPGLEITNSKPESKASPGSFINRDLTTQHTSGAESATTSAESGKFANNKAGSAADKSSGFANNKAGSAADKSSGFANNKAESAADKSNGLANNTKAESPVDKSAFYENPGTPKGSNKLADGSRQSDGTSGKPANVNSMKGSEASTKGTYPDTPDASFKYSGLTPEQIQQYRSLDQGLGNNPAGPPGYKGWDAVVADPKNPAGKEAASAEETLKKAFDATKVKVDAGGTASKAELDNLHQLNSKFIEALRPMAGSDPALNKQLDQLKSLYQTRLDALLYTKGGSSENF